MERPSAAENGDLGEFSVVDVVQDGAGREPGCYRCVGGGGGGDEADETLGVPATVDECHS